MSELVEKVEIAICCGAVCRAVPPAECCRGIRRIEARAALAVVAEWLTAERFLASATAIREQIDAKEPPHA